MPTPKLFLNGGGWEFLRTAVKALTLLLALGDLNAGARGQTAPKAEVSASSIPSQNEIPPRPAPACCGYPFPRSTDAEIADPNIHTVHYQDAHVMFLEVTNPPMLGVSMLHMHGHPFTSVFAHDSDTGPRNPAAPFVPKDQIDPHGDPGSGYNDMGSNSAPPPAGMKWPTCNTSAPQAPHQGPFNTGSAPNHFYRLELLRAEGEDFPAHWKEWYPEIQQQPQKQVKDLVPGAALGPNFSEQWPYPIVYDSIQAAPNNYKLLFEDAKMRLIEVTIRPGETTPMHGHPYPSVIVYNGISGDPSLLTEVRLDPGSPLNGQGAGRAAAPKLYNLKSPTCETMAPEAPHKIHNGGAVPLHYYRIEYKRIDGDDLTDNWKKWYPWMLYMPFMR
jgi:hypothetical protein